MKKSHFWLLFLSISVILCLRDGNNRLNANNSVPVSPFTFLDESRDIPEGWKFETLECEKRVHVDNDTSKQGMLINVSLQYPVIAPANINLKKVQESFAVIFRGNESSALTPQEAFDERVAQFVTGAEEEGRLWKEESNEYINFSFFEDNLATDVHSMNNHVITTSTGGYSYMGGAHGSYYVKYDNIDLRDGSIISENMLFRPGYEGKLAKLIQDAVAERNNSEDETDHISLLVELNQIEPNGNFILSYDGIDYIYNQYEISPYVQGVVEVNIPYEDIAALISERYLEIIENIQSN